MGEKLDTPALTFGHKHQFASRLAFRLAGRARMDPCSWMNPDKKTRLREFAERYTAAWCSQDAARVADFFSADGSLAINGGAPAVGRGAITQAAQGFMTAFPDLMVMMDDVVDQGERMIYKWTLVGTNTGPGGTGHRVRISGFENWRIGADGLVAKSEGNFDSAAYQRQLGRGAEAEP